MEKEVEKFILMFKNGFEIEEKNHFRSFFSQKICVTGKGLMLEHQNIIDRRLNRLIMGSCFLVACSIHPVHLEFNFCMWLTNALGLHTSGPSFMEYKKWS